MTKVHVHDIISIAYLQISPSQPVRDEKRHANTCVALGFITVRNCQGLG